ncbi:hypothetical protein Sta7437_0282 [Stanieria cyanosphaera PCC 7437]|uniref:Uncharacterized protein n=1 Tax=Stanieria cyanosphaera (strain ATCC 29371 / PCC 7437) TaxID=111780 RepID=K9XQF2_STAC7|nr:hypothetical protein [Stanieria cyanosphaera]AFZ33897.1 hypothetical protein Sta7437_0282 [Stanieria cyanosphaera PCC 7437]
MSKLYNITWAIAIAITITGMQWQRAVSKVTPKTTNTFSDSLNQKQDSLLLVSNRPICQKIGRDYQEIYSFETQNFYINICRLEDNFFYYRQSKLNPRYQILLPATLVFGGDYYQAVDGHTVYLVGINSDGYYSSVMQNNNEIIFEPEIQSSSTIAQNSWSNNLNLNENNEDTNTEQLSQICTNDKNDLRPSFSGWQEFIGTSPEVIGKYAVSNGYDFSYNSDNVAEAIINTTNGLQVIFNIEKTTQIVNGICVNSVTSQL